MYKVIVIRDSLEVLIICIWPVSDAQIINSSISVICCAHQGQSEDSRMQGVVQIYQIARRLIYVCTRD